MEQLLDKWKTQMNQYVWHQLEMSFSLLFTVPAFGSHRH